MDYLAELNSNVKFFQRLFSEMSPKLGETDRSSRSGVEFTNLERTSSSFEVLTVMTSCTLALEEQQHTT